MKLLPKKLLQDVGPPNVSRTKGIMGRLGEIHTRLELRNAAASVCFYVSSGTTKVILRLFVEAKIRDELVTPIGRKPLPPQTLAFGKSLPRHKDSWEFLRKNPWIAPNKATHRATPND